MGAIWDFIEDKDFPSPQEEVIQLNLKQLIYDALDSHSEREANIIKMRFGLGDGNEHTLEEVGNKYKVTRERIRQIKETANKRLLHKPKRSYLSRTIFDLFGELVVRILSEKGGFCSIDELRQVIGKSLNWGVEEQWIINWFDEVFGE